MLVLYTTLILATASPQEPQGEAPPEVTLTTLRSDIRALELSFGGLKVESECNWTKREADEDEFKNHGGLEATLWFSSKPGGFARCDFHEETSRWKRGPSEFAESSFLATYDGRVGQVLRRKTGSQGQAVAIKRAIFVPHRPSHVELGARVSGWRFSTIGFFDQLAGRFSEMLEYDRDNLTVETLVDGAVRRVLLQRVVSLGDVDACESWLMDPDRAYALVDYKYSEGGTVQEHVAIEQLTESRGLYWPAMVTRVSLLPDGAEAREEMHMKATTLSHDEVAEVDWHITLASGTTLEDPISDVVLTIGYSENELNPLLDLDSDLLAASLRDSEPVDSGLLILADSTEDQGQAWSLTRIALFAGGLLIAAFALARFLVATRQADRRLVAASAALTLAVLLSAQPNAQQVSLVADELGTHRIHNCGVNASAVILRAFGKESQLDVVAAGLDCGDHWERVVSLGQISTVLEARGLTVKPLQNLKPEQILARLGRGNIALLHLESPYQADGHFILLGGTRREEVLEIDPARSSRWVTISDFLASRRHAITGYGLLVSGSSPSEKKPIPTLPANAATFALDMGDVSEVEGIVTTSVRLHNREAAPLSLTTSASSCTCFQGALFDSGRKAIPAGSEDVLHLQFDRAKLGVGENEQNVVITLEAGASKRTVMFRVRALIRSTEVSRKVAVMPRQIDWGVVRDKAQLGKAKRVSLQLPSGVVVVSVKPSSENLQVRRVRSTSDKGTKYRSPSRTETFEVSILSASKDYLNEEVLFVLSDPQLKTVRIAVLAEVPQ
jgi:hypothetical protein